MQRRSELNERGNKERERERGRETERKREEEKKKGRGREGGGGSNSFVDIVIFSVCVCVCCDWFWGCQESLGRKVVIRVILICLELCCFRIRGKGREGRVQVHIF